MRHYKIALAKSGGLGEAIKTAGGKVYVTTAGGTAKLALTDKTGAALTNPVSINYGIIEFYTADTVPAVDLYGYGPTGHAIMAKNVKPSGDNELFVNTSGLITTLVIPFNIADTTATTETSTGFVIPTGAGVVPMPVSVDVATADSGITIDVGTLSTDSGDADGYIDGISVASATTVKATLTNGSVTLGALLKVQDSANAGDAVPEAGFTMGGKTVTYTLSSGADTAAGFIKLPLALPVSSVI